MSTELEPSQIANICKTIRNFEFQALGLKYAEVEHIHVGLIREIDYLVILTISRMTSEI